ncbi:MAG: DUF305 domain-containing protein [Candidatus Daviesbacteria bacterium]|nr:DUF305 domain-containing protein [Candidatus Daviesbacteria bacterium]
MEQKWLYGIIGLLAGILIAVLIASNAVNSNNQGMMRIMGMKSGDMMEEGEEMHKGGMDMSMNEMSESLKGKSGDEFDKAFVRSMIDHHLGAIDMANLAKINAKHGEIKSLAEDIINAQTKEIEMMKQWSQSWGY